MSDEPIPNPEPTPTNPPEQNIPEIPPEDLVESPKEEKVVKPYHSKLDLLPEYIKKDLHDLIRNGMGEQRIKNAIEERYLGKTKFLPAAKETYRYYINAHKEELMKEVNIQKAILDSTKESLGDMKDILGGEIDGSSIENKKRALERLYDRCNKRIQLIESSQSTILSAQLESVIGAYLREQRSILETLLTLQTELRKDTTAQLYAEMENITYDWCVRVLDIYKKLHGEDKISEFKLALKEELPKILRSRIQ
jgi:hypothetical protein